MKKNKRHIFSLVELFCIIIIAGLIVITSIFTLLKMFEDNKIDDKLSKEETIIKACERYISKYREEAPLVIGDTSNIELEKLIKINYLSWDICESNEKCISDSYVRVYKLNEKEYTYLPYLYLNNSKVKDGIEEVPSPVINLLFIDGKEENNNNLIFNNINESRIYIDMSGGTDSFEREIHLYTYEIMIYMSTITNPDLVNVYSSKPIYANNRYEVTIDKKIMSYVNAKEATKLKVVVRAVNTLGGVSEVTSLVQANNNGN